MSKFPFGLLLSFASAQEPSVKEPTSDELWAKEGLRKSDVMLVASYAADLIYADLS